MSVVKKIIRDYGNFTVDIQNWEILDKGITALWGASGSGKSSAVRCLLGLDPKAEVSWLFEDEDIALRPVEERNLGVVFQDLALFPHMSARGNILFAVRKRNQDVEHRLQRIIAAMELEPIIDQSVEKLSGGEQQRVAVARALINQPRLLLLDEPFSSLDEEVRDKTRQLVKDMTQELKIPVLLITHDRQDIYHLADKVSRMKQGSIVGDQSVADFRQKG